MACVLAAGSVTIKTQSKPGDASARGTKAALSRANPKDSMCLTKMEKLNLCFNS